MKKLLALLLAAAVMLPISAFAQEEVKEFVVYSDKASRDNHFIPSGWMGDYGDVKLNDQSMDNPHSGNTCMQFTYSGKKSQGMGWAGMYWQNPANNWGNKKGGFDLTGMTKLSLWARGAKGGEVIQKFMIGGIQGTYPDSASAESAPIELTDTWKEYTINLAGKDLSYINGGFAWIASADQNPEGAVFYVDDVKFEADPAMKAEGRKQESMPFYVYADRSSIGNHYIPSGWMGDYGDLKYSGSCKDNPYLGDSCINYLQRSGYAGSALGRHVLAEPGE